MRVCPLIGGWRWPLTCAEGAPPSLRARGKAGRGAQTEQAGERCTRWGHTGAQMRTGRTRNTKAKRPFKGGEGENHGNTGSTAPAPAARLRFCGPSPTKAEPSGFCLMLLAHYGCPIGEKALSDGQQVYMPNMAKMWQKTAKKCTELAVNHQNGTNFSQQECFSVVLARAGHFEGLQPSPVSQAAASTKFSPKRTETARKTA